METVTCPYCRRDNHTSSPFAMAECAYCGKRFAEAETGYQTLVILDNRLTNAWQVAEDLMAEWREKGQLEKEAIVDRRLEADQYGGEERRGIVARSLRVSTAPS